MGGWLWSVRSPRETLLRLLIRDAGLPEPEINFWIYDDDGRFLTESDLVYPEEKVVLEYEGDHHRTDVVQWRKDIARRERSEEQGEQQREHTTHDGDDRLHHRPGLDRLPHGQAEVLLHEPETGVVDVREEQ